MKRKNDFQAQRDVLKSLSEGGPGSTRWGNRTPADREKQGRRVRGDLIDKMYDASEPVSSGGPVRKYFPGRGDVIDKIEDRLRRVDAAVAKNRLAAKADANAMKKAKGDTAEAKWRNSEASLIRTGRRARDASRAARKERGRLSRVAATNSIRKAGLVGSFKRDDKADALRAGRVAKRAALAQKWRNSRKAPGD